MQEQCIRVIIEYSEGTYHAHLETNNGEIIYYDRKIGEHETHVTEISERGESVNEVYEKLDELVNVLISKKYLFYFNREEISIEKYDINWEIVNLKGEK